MAAEIWEIWFTRSDKRVCEKCAALHGRIFRQGTGPIPGKGTHPGCRCIRKEHHVRITQEPPRTGPFIPLPWREPEPEEPRSP